MRITKQYAKGSSNNNSLFFISIGTLFSIFIMLVFITIYSHNSDSKEYKENMWKMKNMNNIVRLQLGVLSENEEDISMNSLFEEKLVFLNKNNTADGKLVFVTPLGYLDKKISSNNDYFVLNFYQNEGGDKKKEMSFCLDYFKYLRSHEDLVGFNENNQNVITLDEMIQDDNWLNLMCNNFVNKEREGMLNIGIKTKSDYKHTE